jgi:hypothetical protein
MLSCRRTYSSRSRNGSVSRFFSNVSASMRTVAVAASEPSAVLAIDALVAPNDGAAGDCERMRRDLERPPCTCIHAARRRHRMQR